MIERVSEIVIAREAKKRTPISKEKTLNFPLITTDRYNVQQGLEGCSIKEQQLQRKMLSLLLNFRFGGSYP